MKGKYIFRQKKVQNGKTSIFTEAIGDKKIDYRNIVAILILIIPLSYFSIFLGTYFLYRYTCIDYKNISLEEWGEYVFLSILSLGNTHNKMIYGSELIQFKELASVKHNIPSRTHSKGMKTERQHGTNTLHEKVSQKKEEISQNTKKNSQNLHTGNAQSGYQKGESNIWKNYTSVRERFKKMNER